MTETRPPALLWPITLAAVAVLGSLAVVCMMPFVAVATIAAATLSRGSALVTVAGAWGANQLIGYGLLGYPLDAHSVGWGLALGVASLAVVPVAARIAGATLVRLVAAFAAAFLLWEGLLFAFALVAGGLETFTPAIVARLLGNEALWLLVLVALHQVATRAATRVFGRAPPLRLG